MNRFVVFKYNDNPANSIEFNLLKKKTWIKINNLFECSTLMFFPQFWRVTFFSLGFP